jgi:hypothetical protein
MIVTQQLDGFWRQSTNQALDRKSFISDFFEPPKKREITANNW